MIKELILKNRSYRRFCGNYHIDKDLLEELLNNVRFIASAKNIQPLRYCCSNKEEMNKKIFTTLSWAGFVPEFKYPKRGERPSAYIIVCTKKGHSFAHYDAGIAAQTILLNAVEKGLGGCIFAAVNRKQLADELGLENDLEILLVLGLGKPKQKIFIEDMSENNFKYYFDSNEDNHVPKRSLREIIIRNYTE